MKNQYLNFFKDVPKTGVIYVLEKAIEYGYKPSDTQWANLGQGAPETGQISSSDKSSTTISINPDLTEYAPVGGTIELRKKIADYYNQTYRKNKKQHYTYKNICITGGGRMALSRVVTAIGNINLGHFIPDYTAYEELLGMFKMFAPIPILLDPEKHFKITPSELKNEIIGKGLSALLLSNPCNPTGQVILGDDLNTVASISRELNCMLIIDEFYSHYIYNQEKVTVSSAEYVENVNDDPIIIINGMSKNWRSPGWRIGWVVGPEKIIEKVLSVGSFLDGGAVHVMQKEALSKIQTEEVDNDARILQNVFIKKRDVAVNSLKKLGFIIECEPISTFYIWVKLTNLPKDLQDGLSFFEACLKEKVIVVPGIFFDVNPGKRRMSQYSRYKNYARISFGPSLSELKMGLTNLEKVIKKYKN